jgi:hypothetical protein
VGLDGGRRCRARASFAERSTSLRTAIPNLQLLAMLEYEMARGARMACRVIASAVMGVMMSTVVGASPQVSPLLGVWMLDVSKVPLPPGAKPPLSVTLTLRDLDDSRWNMVIDTVNADGSRRHAESTFRLDGAPAAVSDSAGAEVDTASITCPNASTMVIGATTGGQLSTTRVFTVSADGRHETETIIWRGLDGKPHTRTNSWTRERAKRN